MDLDPPDRLDYRLEAEQDDYDDSWLRFLANYELTEDEKEVAAVSFYHAWNRK